MKIKWNDDRVRGATTALLLIGRDRLSRGETGNLIQAALTEYREDPAGYKLRRATWAEVRDVGPLTNPQHQDYYRKLVSAVDAIGPKLKQDQRQFSSLLELDNFLVTRLGSVR